MQISSRVYLLARGYLGCSLSHPNDCNVHAVRCGSRYFLIDAGVGLESDRILSELKSDKIQSAQVEGILLTHGHLDHSGGARGLHEALAAPISSPRQTAGALESADEEAISLAAAKSAGIYGPEVGLSACPVEQILEDRHHFDRGDCRITILLSSTWDCDPQAYAASLRSLAELKIDGLYRGDGSWSVSDSSRHLEQSLRFVDQLLLPPNLM